MTDNIIHFPTTYLPTFEELERLDSWQTQWKVWRAELRQEWDIQGLRGHERVVSLERFHIGCRRNWKIFTGMKNNIEFVDKSG
jgi:hypothetical protein